MNTSAKGHVVLTTGSREFDRRDLVEAELANLPTPAFIIHGGARGADRMVSETIHQMNGLTEIRVPYLAKLEKKGGWERNKKMREILDVFHSQGYDCWALAFHEDIKNPSPGTSGMVKLLKEGNYAIVHIDGRTGQGY